MENTHVTTYKTGSIREILFQLNADGHHVTEHALRVMVKQKIIPATYVGKRRTSTSTVSSRFWRAKPPPARQVRIKSGSARHDAGGVGCRVSSARRPTISSPSRYPRSSTRWSRSRSSGARLRI